MAAGSWEGGGKEEIPVSFLLGVLARTGIK